ncbi:integrase [Constrictibacter sp. MBR-5]|jgi:integrase|uniref:tyrosine-type recombinase/integrase n=1 Tax=Constrictibacter sp. MBR-5 TaxID=3156467 RepID=UPI00339A5001
MKKHVIFPGLQLYTRADMIGDSLYCYFKYGRKPVRRSMGTADLGIAIQRAVDLYNRFQAGEGDRVAEKAVRKPSFASAAQSFLKSVASHSDYANKETVVRRFFVPFFGEELGRTIDAVTQGDIAAYLEWRRTYHSRPRQSEQVAYDRNGKRILAKRQTYGEPTGKTLNRENIALRQLLDHAATKGWLKKADVPTVPAMKQKKNRREAISPTDYERMISVAQERVQNAPDERQRYQRTVLRDFIIVVRHTGLRPHEAFGLTWADVRIADRVLRVRGGKTGRRDVALIDDDVVEHLLAIRKRHTDAQEGKLDPSTAIFTGFDGTPTGSVKKSFENLIAACQFGHAVADDYCPYSLRHLFATDMVGRGCVDGVLAKLMGTSRRMLDHFYDQSTVEMARRWVEERERAGRHLRRLGEADELRLLDPDLDDRRIVLGPDGVLRVEAA